MLLELETMNLLLRRNDTCSPIYNRGDVTAYFSLIDNFKDISHIFLPFTEQ